MKTKLAIAILCIGLGYAIGRLDYSERLWAERGEKNALLRNRDYYEKVYNYKAGWDACMEQF